MAETRTSLILRVRDLGDGESWREFTDLYEPLLLSYVRSQGLVEHDARDVVQEIFLSLLRHLPSFELDHKRGRFRTWLWKLACNAVVDFQRRKARQSRAEDAWLQQQPPEAADSGPDEREAAWAAAHRQRVLDFVLARVRTQVEPRTWACFEMHLLNGQSSAAVAAELGCTSNVVYVNASRVLARVRQQCAHYLEELGDAPDALPS